MKNVRWWLLLALNLLSLEGHTLPKILYSPFHSPTHIDYSLPPIENNQKMGAFLNGSFDPKPLYIENAKQLFLINKKCSVQVEDVIDLTKKYGEEAKEFGGQLLHELDLNPKDTSLKRRFKLIQTRLSKKSECQLDILRAYAIASISLLLPNDTLLLKSKNDQTPPQLAKDLSYYYSQENKKFDFSRNPQLKKNLETHLTFVNGNASLVQLALVLVNLNRVSFFEGNFAKKNRLKVLGGYNCDSSQIGLSFDQPPLNLAATFLHEMDHLFRDKFYDNSKDDIVSSTLNDEMMAILYSGYAQRKLRVLQEKDLWKTLAGPYETENRDGDTSPQLTIRRTPFTFLKEDSFNFKSDNNFFSEEGDLVSLVSGFFNHEYNTYNKAQYNYGFDTFVRMTTQQSERYGSYLHFENIYSKSQDIYFSGAETGKFDPAYITPEHGHGFNYLAQLADRLLIHVQLSNRTTVYSNEFVQFINTLKEKLDRPSISCTNFQKELKGRLKNYVGSDLKLTEIQTSSIKPGGEGVKPGSEGVKPGSEGMKPCFDFYRLL